MNPVAAIFKRNRSPIMLLFLLTSWLGSHGESPSQPVLVELFTSEGCSSCPPADRLLMELDRKQPVPGANIIVLSEHVDYWNSLGWRDPYSSHQWSERQSDYAGRFNLESVYTPQMVVAGAREVNGSDDSAVRAAIKKSVATPGVTLSITNPVKKADTLEIEFAAGASTNAVVYAVFADDSDRSTVARGENAGRTLDHVAVARSLVQVAELGPSPVDKELDIRLPPEAGQRRLRLVLFAQDRKSGHIVGVVQREL